MTISARHRRYAFERAGRSCAYCLIDDGGEPTAYLFDHIIPNKHDGADTSDNLCLSCAPCNRYQGSEIAAIDPLTGEANKLFNSRQQKWREHFKINSDGPLSGMTAEDRTAVAAPRMKEAPRM